MYYATIAAAALHQVLLRTMTKALRDDNVVAQNVASGLFCVLFVALGVADRPTLLAATMLGYLVSDSASVTTAGYAVHHVVTAIERVKKTWRGRPNPYDRGAFRNWLDFFCRPTPSVVLELDQVESRCEAA